MPSINEVGCLLATSAVGPTSGGDSPAHLPSGLSLLLQAILQRLPVQWLDTHFWCTLRLQHIVFEKLHTLPAVLLQHDSYLKAIARALHRGNSESQFAAVVVIKYLVAHSASTHYVLAQVSHLSLVRVCMTRSRCMADPVQTCLCACMQGALSPMLHCAWESHLRLDCACGYDACECTQMSHHNVSTRVTAAAQQPTKLCHMLQQHFCMSKMQVSRP